MKSQICNGKEYFESARYLPSFHSECLLVCNTPGTQLAQILITQNIGQHRHIFWSWFDTLTQNTNNMKMCCCYDSPQVHELFLNCLFHSCVWAWRKWLQMLLTHPALGEPQGFRYMGMLMFTLCVLVLVGQKWCFCVVVVVEWLVCVLLLFFEQMLEQTLSDGATNRLPEFLTMPCMVRVHGHGNSLSNVASLY